MVSIGRLLFLTDVPSTFEPYVVQPNYYCVGMIDNGGLKSISVTNCIVSSLIH